MEHKMQDGKYVILCIDDDPDVLETLQILLQANGYTTITAPNAEEGLKLYQSQRPDLVLLDLMMEDIDSGTKVLRKLQDVDPDIPIYLLSSAGDLFFNTIDYRNIGLSGVFQKPITPNVLLSLLRTKLHPSK
jgi:DNA-binding response OmpR family regulator